MVFLLFMDKKAEDGQLISKMHVYNGVNKYYAYSENTVSEYTF